MRRFVLLAVFLAVALVGSASAGEEEKSPLAGFNYFLGGSAGVPASQSSEAFYVGWGITGGVGYHFHGRLNLQADYLYSSYNVRSDLIPETGASLTGVQRMQWSTVDVGFDVIEPGRVVSLKVLAGPGIYFRTVSIEQITGVQLVTFCSPGTFFCFPTPTPTTTVLGARSSIDPGGNLGFKLGFSLGFPTQIYLEARFHFIYGPLIDIGTGTRRANGYYFPIVVGFQYF